MIDPATVTWRHKQFYSFNDSPCRVVGIRRSMAKAKTVYVCQECGGVSAKWQGQCPHCQAWNTMVETVERGNAPTAPNRYAHLAEAAPVRNLADIEARDTPRQPTGLSEFDRVLGGGLVPGGVVLIGGDPGIGKSTLLLQALAALSLHTQVLYIPGEESAERLPCAPGAWTWLPAPCSWWRKSSLKAFRRCCN